MVPDVVVAGVTVVAPVTTTDDGWVEAVVVVVVVVVVEEDGVVDVVDDVNDVTGATGTATGSSVNTSGLPAAVEVNPEEAGSLLDVVMIAVGGPDTDEITAGTVETADDMLS